MQIDKRKVRAAYLNKLKDSWQKYNERLARPFTISSMEEWLWTLSNWNIGSLTRKALAG